MFGENAIHVMLDLETAGTTAGSVILQLAAVGFTLKNSEELIGKDSMLNIRISPVDSFQHGFTANTETMDWWHEQDPDLYRTVFSGRTYVYEAISAFTHYINKLGSKESIYIWGNGANFDPVLLEAYYKQFDLDVPWHFRNVCCFRTLKNLHRDAYEKAKGKYINSNPHDALCDALWQAQITKEILDGIS